MTGAADRTRSAPAVIPVEPPEVSELRRLRRPMRRWPLAACGLVLLGLYAVPFDPVFCTRWEQEGTVCAKTAVLWRWSGEAVENWAFWPSNEQQSHVAAWAPAAAGPVILAFLLIRHGAAAGWVACSVGAGLLWSVMYFFGFAYPDASEPLDRWVRTGWPVLVPLTLCLVAGGCHAAGRSQRSLAIAPLLPSVLLLIHAAVFLVAPAALSPGSLMREVMRSQIPNRPASVGGLLRLALAMATVGAGVAGLIYAIGRQRVFARTGLVLAMIALAAVLLLDVLQGYRFYMQEIRYVTMTPDWRTVVLAKFHKLLPAAVGMLLAILGTSRLWVGYRLRQLAAEGGSGG